MAETNPVTLDQFIPGPSVAGISDWFAMHRVNLVFTRGRRSKTGDFRPPRNGAGPAISINKNLNRYACLITLVHEMAHYQAFSLSREKGLFQRRKKVAPHGREWKEEYRRLMAPFLTSAVFPGDLLQVLSEHMKNPRASTYSDALLARVLLRYDESLPGILLDEVPDGSAFIAANGDMFRKERKIRTRFRCMRLRDRKIYLFSPFARVIPVKPEK